jgi:ArsR family transcriptional regulator
MLAATEQTERKRGTRCCDVGDASPVDEAGAQALSDDLAILAHPIRLQILAVLAAREGQVCVCDLEGAVPVKQPTVSHHLKLLREAGLVEVERHGLWAYYGVRREALAALRERIATGLTALG